MASTLTKGQKKSIAKELYLHGDYTFEEIADKVNIEMPEPSEIDLIQDRIYDPKTVLDEYCNKYGLNSPANINARKSNSDVIVSVFDNIKSSFNSNSNTVGSNEEITATMQDILNSDGKNKKFNQ